MANATQIVITARDETQQAIKGVQSGLATLERQAIGLGPVFAGLGAALSIGAFKSTITSAIEFAARLDDMAEATGASVENLSALSSVAKVGGHDLGNVEAALQKLGKALHSSDDESKGAAKALSAIGLSVEDLREKDPAAAMLDIAKAMDQFKDGSGKAAVAMAILGKSGAQMLPFLNDLAEKSELVGKITAEQAKQAEQYEKNMNKLSTSFGVAGKTAAMELLPFLETLTNEMVDAKEESASFASMIGEGVRTALETVSVLGVEVAYVFKSAGREIGGISAQIAALGSGNFAGFSAIGEAMKADAAKAREDVDALTARLLDRSKKTAEEIDKSKKSLSNFVSAPERSSGARSKDADAAQALIEKLDKQISVRALDLATTEKLTAAEKESAEVRQQLDAGTLKATSNQRRLIDGKLDFLVAADKELVAQEKAKKSAEELAKVEILIGDYRNNNATTLERIQRESELALMTERQREIAEALYRVEDDGQKIRERIIRDLPDEIAQKEALAKVESELASQKDKVSEATAKNQSVMKSFDFGWEKSFQRYADEAENAAKKAETVFTTATDSMTNAMTDFAMTGKLNFKDMANDIVRQMIRIQMQAAASGIVNYVGGAVKGYFGGTGQTAGQAAIGADINSAGLGGFAKGGAFGSGGEIHAFANGGVVSSPTLFKFAKGTGLMGEAGPEAIMPLSRDSSGRLGVKASNSAAEPPAINITVNNQAAGDGYEATASAKKNGAGFDIKVLVAKVIADDQRRNGPITQGFANTFGMNRSAA